MSAPSAPTIDDIFTAVNTIDGAVDVTPLVSASVLSERVGADVVLKAECLQRAGSFKIRGATNKVHSLGAAASCGVIAGSAGNHARSLSLAARRAGVPCTIVVPASAPATKVDACRALGADVIECPGSVDDAISAARDLAEELDRHFCPPFDDAATIAGQGTLGLELIDQLPNAETVLIPVGGGGLAGGVAVALRALKPTIRLIGVQAAAYAPYVHEDVATTSPATLADGIAVKQPGQITGPLVHNLLDDIVTVGEEDIADAMTMLLEKSRLVVEGAGAVGIAALLNEPSLATGVTAVVLSGGNVDLEVLQRLIRRRESRAGRRVIVDAVIDDRPGALAELLVAFASESADLIEVTHLREGIDLGLGATAVRATFRVRDPDHADRARAAAQAAGFTINDAVVS
ncbi:MAG: pyridoxal-phosphate dependent enzyme [Actinomycetota bacterium]